MTFHSRERSLQFLYGIQAIYALWQQRGMFSIKWVNYLISVDQTVCSLTMADQIFEVVSNAQPARVLNRDNQS